MQRLGVIISQPSFGIEWPMLPLEKMLIKDDHSLEILQSHCSCSTKGDFSDKRFVKRHRIGHGVEPIIILWILEILKISVMCISWFILTPGIRI